jgi:hypothetical protein
MTLTFKRLGERRFSRRVRYEELGSEWVEETAGGWPAYVRPRPRPSQYSAWPAVGTLHVDKHASAALGDPDLLKVTIEALEEHG